MAPTPTSERVGLISDVHGNLTALEAVLADIDARGITRIFNLGDDVGKLRGRPFSHDFTMSGRRIRVMHAPSETVHRRVRYHYHDPRSR